MATYKVAKGDTLGKIAKANGLTLSQLLELNPSYKANPDMVSIGADITISGSPSTDSTADSPSGPGSELLLPGNAELWLNSTTGEHWVVYQTPGVTLADGTKSEPTYYSWRIESDADLEAAVGPGVTAIPHFTGDEAAFTTRGVVDLGVLSNLNLEDLEGDPFDTWVEDLTALAAVQPWILDPDYVALVVNAMMERADGSVSLAEIQGTKWWKEHNAAQRVWMETAASDPATADQLLADNRESLRKRLADMGVNNPSEKLLAFMADKTTTGDWSTSHLDAQIAAISDPYSVDTIDDELFTFMASEDYTLDQTTDMEDTVRKHLRTWLGPVYGTLSDEEIARKAGELRNDPDAEAAWVESLKDQRVAMYPGQTDRELSYEAISSPWRSFAQNMWGAPVDDKDDVFQDVLRANDQRTASKMLRTAGLERGYEKTVSEVMSGLKTGMKSNVRGAV